jgi:hypothetical protein
MRQLTSELGRTTSALARTLDQAEEREADRGPELGQLVEQGREVVGAGRSLVAEVRELVPLVKEVLAEVRDLRREASRQGEQAIQLLARIAEAPPAAAPAPAPPVPRQADFTEEERLLLDSFAAYPGGLQQQQLGLVMQQQLLQQQLVQQQLARQQPGLQVAPAFPAGITAPMFPALPPAAAPAARLPPAPTAAPNNVVMRSSDPLPSPLAATLAPAPAVMAVTVPPQHRLGGAGAGPSTPRQQALPSAPATPLSAYRTPSAPAPATPHSYQMQMPAGASPLVSSPFGAEAGPAVVLTTQALLSTINTPVFSAVTPEAKVGCLQIRFAPSN